MHKVNSQYTDSKQRCSRLDTDEIYL